MLGCACFPWRSVMRNELSWSAVFGRTRWRLASRSGRGSCCWLLTGGPTGGVGNGWRRRFEADVLSGLLDGDRPGRPPTYGHDDVLLLVKTVTEDPPEEATRWT